VVFNKKKLINKIELLVTLLEVLELSDYLRIILRMKNKIKVIIKSKHKKGLMKLVTLKEILKLKIKMII
jgi:hypothetical protein